MKIIMDKLTCTAVNEPRIYIVQTVCITGHNCNIKTNTNKYKPMIIAEYGRRAERTTLIYSYHVETFSYPRVCGFVVF